MSDNEEIQVAAPKRGRPAKVEVVIEEATASTADKAWSEGDVSEHTRREMEAGRKVLEQFK